MTQTGRPTYSLEGFLRKMQMSQVGLWILVEGLLDRAFYGRMLDQRGTAENVAYIIALPTELIGGRGDGKQILLSLYRLLRSRRVLTSTLGGKKTVVLFLLDKDIDDLEKTKARSDHVVYTQFYCAENYAFRFGDLASALSVAAFLDIREVRSYIGRDSAEWTLSAAQRWRTWIEYCLLVRRLRIIYARNYALRTSLMHATPYGACDFGVEKRLLISAKRNARLSAREFNAMRERVRKYVGRIFAKGNQDSIFNGRWYVGFLVEDAKNIARARRYNSRGLENRLLACLVATLDFSDDWATHFNEAVVRIINKLRNN